MKTQLERVHNIRLDLTGTYYLAGSLDRSDSGHVSIIITSGDVRLELVLDSDHLLGDQIIQATSALTTN